MRDIFFLFKLLFYAIIYPKKLQEYFNLGTLFLAGEVNESDKSRNYKNQPRASFYGRNSIFTDNGYSILHSGYSNIIIGGLNMSLEQKTFDIIPVLWQSQLKKFKQQGIIKHDFQDEIWFDEDKPDCIIYNTHKQILTGYNIKELSTCSYLYHITVGENGLIYITLSTLPKDNF